MWRFVSLSALFGTLAALSPLAAEAGVMQRLQDGSADVCWSPDHEWPVPCNEE